MSKNMRRVTKQKWYSEKDNKKIFITRVVENNSIKYINHIEGNDVAEDNSRKIKLIEEYIKKSKNSEKLKKDKSNFINENPLENIWTHFSDKTYKNIDLEKNFIYRRLKRHEQEALKKGYKYIRFFQEEDHKCNDLDKIYVNYDRKNLPQDRKFQNRLSEEEGMVKICVKKIKEEEINEIIIKNKFVNTLNHISFNYVYNIYLKTKNRNIIENYSKFDYSKFIYEYHKNFKRYLVENKTEIRKVLLEEDFFKFLQYKLKNKKKSFKIVKEIHYLDNYYYQMIYGNKDPEIILEDNKKNFYKLVNHFKNLNYQMKESFGKYKKDRDNIVFKHMNQPKGNVENRILHEKIKRKMYRNEDNYDLNKIYQINENIQKINKNIDVIDNNKRMESIIELYEKNNNIVNNLIDEVINIFEVEIFLEKILNNINVLENEEQIVKISQIQKDHYLKVVVPNVKNSKFLIDGNYIEPKKLIMKKFNGYLKGRTLKIKKSFKNDTLSLKYIKDIYNTDKIEKKFKKSFINKINQYEIQMSRNKKLQDEKEIRKNSNNIDSYDLQKEKLLQTYMIKLVDNINYCSKVPINEETRCSDILCKKEKKEIAPSKYILEYLHEFYNDEKSLKIIMKKSVNDLEILQKEVYDLKFDLNNSLHGEISKEFSKETMINDLNKRQGYEFEKKLKFNNLHKYFEGIDLHNLYKSYPTDYDINLLNNSLNLVKFDKIYNLIVRELFNGSYDNIDKINFKQKDIALNKTIVDMIKNIYENNNLSSETIQDEEKQAIKYLLNTVYTYKFSNYLNQNKKIKNLKNRKLELQIEASKFKDVTKQNIQYNKFIYNKFKEFLDETSILKNIEFKYIDKKKQETNLKNILKLNEGSLEKITFKNLVFNGQCMYLLMNLSLYLDMRKLSFLIHDTKKLINSLEHIKYFEKEEERKLKKVLESEIEVMNFILYMKKNLNNIKKSMSTVNLDLYISTLNKLVTSKEKSEEYYQSYDEVKINKNSKLYVEDGEVVLYYGLSKILRHNLLEFFNNLIELKSNDKYIFKISKKNIQDYVKLSKNFNDDFKKRNKYLNSFNKKIKGLNNHFKNYILEQSVEKKDYQEIKKINKRLIKYEYLKNKINFKHLSIVNNFIDDVLTKLNNMMIYWERDANLLFQIEHKEYSLEHKIFDTENNFKEKYIIEKLIKYLGFTKFIFQDNKYVKKNYEIDNIENNKECINKKDINQLWIRNFLSYNYYYSPNSNDPHLSLLDLINLVYDSLTYNTKYQNDVLVVINKLLEKYFIVGEEHNRPLKYDIKNKKIIINKKYFNSREYKYFSELKSKDSEYVELIKNILEFK